jgi:hypothetical protein
MAPSKPDMDLAKPRLYQLFFLNSELSMNVRQQDLVTHLEARSWLSDLELMSIDDEWVAVTNEEGKET